MSNGGYLDIGPTGGVRLSLPTSNAFFSDERAGDVLLYANSNAQRMLIGNNSNEASHIMITSNGTYAQSTLFTPNIQQTTGINITALTDGALPLDMYTETTTTLANLQRVTSNQAYGIASLTTSNLNNSPLSNVVLGVNVLAPSSFQSNLIVWGDIGVGLSNPAYPLQIATSAPGNISILAAGDIQGFSDRRLKTDLRKIDGALAKVCSISGYTFRRTDTGSERRCAGVVAQEVQEALPEVVDQDASSGMLSVAYGNLSALLIEAVKEMALRPVTATLTVTTTAPDEAFSVPAPERRAWRTAVISAARGAGMSRCCAWLSAGGSTVEGQCELPGEYTVLLVSE